MVKMVNRAKMSTPTTGTGTLTLGSAITGYQTFAASGVANADVVRYTLEDGAAWEIGLGTYTASGTLLSRTLEESSTGSLLNLSGNAEIFVTAAAADVTSDTANTASTLVARDASGNFSAGTVTADGLTVNADALIHDVTVGRGASSVSSNTTVGASALAANTTGVNNTANGYQSLEENTTGVNNTATGYQSLSSNTTGGGNAANGTQALLSNITGSNNVASGSFSLSANTTGANNTAVGYQALTSNTTGSTNVASGASSLSSNTTGSNNTAYGFAALLSNTTGLRNTATGHEALRNNTASNNVANGYQALYSNTTGNSNVATGYQALFSNTTGVNNTANGFSALHLNTTGVNNTANGLQALYYNTTGNSNVATGTRALFANTTGADNTANGYEALRFNTTAGNNSAFGLYALYLNTTGANNTATGSQALRSNTTGSNNVATGYQALYDNTTGDENTAVGRAALANNTTANNNTATGHLSLFSNTTGNSNTANGYYVLYANTTGANNVATGTQALYSNTTGDFNTATGWRSLYSNTASNNTALGYQAGNSLTTGSNNTVIGYDADASSATVSNEITLGNNSVTRFRIPGIGIDWTSADVSIGTLTKTFTAGESSTIDLASSVLAPLVTVTKEIPQTGVTSNSWDVNSNTENYTRLDSAYATTLDFNRYDVSSASYTQSFSVAGQETEPRGLVFNTDGTKMFVVGVTGDDVNEYDLSTAFDISTAVYSQNFSVSAQDINPRGLQFNNNGTKMFVMGFTGSAVYEYNLSTGFDISAAVYSQSFSVSAQDTAPTSLAFNNDGTKMFVLGSTGDDVNEYTLSTGFDVSTASYAHSFSVAAQDSGPTGIAFNADGTKMFVVGSTGDDVNEYSLSTSFDVSTASYVQNFSVVSQDTNPQGIAFNNDGTKMFIVGATNDAVYEYYLTPSLELGTGSFASSDIGKTVEANSGKFVLTNTDGRCAETTQPTSYAQVASGDWEMYGVIYNPVDGDLELSGVADPNLYFDISTAIYEQSFTVSAQDANPNGVAFNADGSKMFVTGSANDSIYEYILSSNFNVETASFVDSLSVASQDTTPQDLTFNTDGTKMFVVGTANNNVYEYDLSTGFSISTAVYSQSFAISSTSGSAIAFNPNGTKMFITFITGSGTGNVREYTLSTGFDVSSATYIQLFAVGAQGIYPQGLAFNGDGTEMFVAHSGNDVVSEYKLTTAFDISTAYYVQNFSFASKDSTITGLAFNNNGSKMYAVGDFTNTVYQYAIGQAYPTGYQSVHTTASIDSTYWTDINSMTADQNAGTGNVYYAISTDDRTTWTVIDNTDGERDIVRNNAGTWQYNSNSAYASETWVNGSTNNELATLSQSMEGASRDATYDISLATFEKTFSVVNQETNPTGIAFNTDGTKMFVTGYSGDDVNEYDLSTAFDISTAVYSQNFSVAAQETAPYGLAFNTDGTKMFVVGANNDYVNEYDLSVGFDISSAVYSQNFSVLAQDVNPRGITFNTDGTKMFVVGITGDDINVYTLSTGFDISTAAYSTLFSVAAQETSPTGVAFNADGTKMFVTGYAQNNVNQYNLSTGFDTSTASYSQSFSVAAQQGFTQGITFNNDGTKMYITGGGAAVYQYDIPENYYANQMDKTQLDAVTDPNHIALSNDLDLAMVFNMTNGTTVPSSNGIAIDYDANVLNKGAILGTDYDFDAPAQDEVRITSLINANLKVRVV
jgi:DNA-binding beta-propeller fold protein YncE